MPLVLLEAAAVPVHESPGVLPQAMRPPQHPAVLYAQVEPLERRCLLNLQHGVPDVAVVRALAVPPAFAKLPHVHIAPPLDPTLGGTDLRERGGSRVCPVH
eukprot:CAMPEP_0114127572 /NCGR_PEP_ID=MMETSP0043_2-20121206/10451_1 /TAXON_ID=464988 /ORGANISM="Hemiselmis andersenii, Strain CCMP644" /LENGTH=100 /DNA_ID=CAMNT_0001220665 /DNA_START=1019 /DNA_END=1318 /DNA_ORIENTATION=-